MDLFSSNIFFVFIYNYGHYFMPIAFIICSLVFINQYKKALYTNNGVHTTAPLVKSTIFTFLSSYYLIMLFTRFYEVHNHYSLGPVFKQIYFYSAALYPLIIGIMLMYKTIESLIKYIKKPRVEKNKHKALAIFLSWAVVTVSYYIYLYFTEFFFILGPIN